MLKHTKTLPERCTPVADKRCQRLDSLNVVGVDIEARLRDQGNVVKIARKIACQRLNEDVRCPVWRHQPEVGTKV